MNGRINSNVFSNLYTLLRLHSTRRTKEKGRLRNYKTWSYEEHQILYENCGRISYSELGKLLPGRTHDAIYTRGKNLIGRKRPKTKNYVRRCPECDAILEKQAWDNRWICPTNSCPVIRVKYKHQKNKVNPEINKIVYEAIGLNSQIVIS